MDRTKVSGTFDVGSIPAGAILPAVLNERSWLIFIAFAFSMLFNEPAARHKISTSVQHKKACKLDPSPASIHARIRPQSAIKHKANSVIEGRMCCMNKYGYRYPLRELNQIYIDLSTHLWALFFNTHFTNVLKRGIGSGF